MRDICVELEDCRRVVSRTDPLARAVGKQAKRAVDATAGLGGDAYRLACLGLSVIAYERCAAVAAVLADGLRRGRAREKSAQAARRIELRSGDARRALPRLRNAPDIVYLDPMFPAKRRASALPRKELVALRALAGEDADARDLFAAALSCARQRVVVKRPDHAEPLAPGPAFSVPGKLVRYDVYLPVPRR
jgi:16S rRNA (guanine1516-N2)-methyltransferase